MESIFGGYYFLKYFFCYDIILATAPEPTSAPAPAPASAPHPHLHPQPSTPTSTPTSKCGGKKKVRVKKVGVKKVGIKKKVGVKKRKNIKTTILQAPKNQPNHHYHRPQKNDKIAEKKCAK